MHIIDPAFPALTGKNEKRVALILNAYAGAPRDVVEKDDGDRKPAVKGSYLIAWCLGAAFLFTVIAVVH
jgi:hypothetical protein